jgi:hypothetical protein
MRKALLLGIGGAIGYVMGAKAGRERYESIRDSSRSLRDRSKSLASSGAGLVENRWPETSEPMKKLGISDTEDDVVSLNDDRRPEPSYSSSAE